MLTSRISPRAVRQPYLSFNATLLPPLTLLSHRIAYVENYHHASITTAGHDVRDSILLRSIYQCKTVLPAIRVTLISSSSAAGIIFPSILVLVPLVPDLPFREFDFQYGAPVLSSMPSSCLESQSYSLCRGVGYLGPLPHGVFVLVDSNM